MTTPEPLDEDAPRAETNGSGDAHPPTVMTQDNTG